MNTNHLKALAAATALSATLFAVPAQAGPFGFLKKIVKQELSELAEKTTQSAVDAATGGAEDSKDKKEGKVEASWQVEKGEAAAPSGDGGFRQEGGTTVSTADNVQAPQGETRGLLLPAVQRTSGIKVATGDMTGDGKDGKPGMSQNGTTVPSADTVQAPKGEERRMLLLPAVQKAQADPRPQAGTTQNGTTVPTAEDVAAPNPPKRGKMVQNGTTVETAGEIQAPEQGE